MGYKLKNFVTNLTSAYFSAPQPLTGFRKSPKQICPLPQSFKDIIYPRHRKYVIICFLAIGFASFPLISLENSNQNFSSVIKQTIQLRELKRNILMDLLIVFLSFSLPSPPLDNEKTLRLILTLQVVEAIPN